MKNSKYLLIPFIGLLLFGSLMVPAKAATVNDDEDDVIGIKEWFEDDSPQAECDLELSDTSMLDIESISWVDASPNYTVTMTFYGTPNATLIAEGDMWIFIYFLIDGTTYSEDEDDTDLEAHLSISSLVGGTIRGNDTALPIQGVLEVSGNSVIWTFNQSIQPVAPAPLEDWDLMAYCQYFYSESIEDITYTYTLLDHYNFDYLEEALLAYCGFLNIPGYSLAAIGGVALITIGIIIKKKY